MRSRMTFKKDINGEEKTVVRVGCPDVYGVYEEKEPISTNFLYGPAIDRLAMYEDTGYSPGYIRDCIDEDRREDRRENKRLLKECCKLRLERDKLIMCENNKIEELKKENEKLKEEIQLLKNTHYYVSNEKIDEETLKFFMECKPTVSLTCAITQDGYNYVLTKIKIEEE